ncbi:hypothetical protein GbCGDNIH6_7213 [Granulibacter bethesdensis]|nr:hypothetical protein GbCGDNIH6_7213 [Granulibacter bethesdensis]
MPPAFFARPDSAVICDTLPIFAIEQPQGRGGFISWTPFRGDKRWHFNICLIRISILFP